MISMLWFVRWKWPSLLSRKGGEHTSKYLTETVCISLSSQFIGSLLQKSDITADKSRFVLTSRQVKPINHLFQYHPLHPWGRCRADSGGWLTHPFPNSPSLSGPINCQQKPAVGSLGNFCFPDTNAAPSSISFFLEEHKNDGRNYCSHPWLWGQGQENEDFCTSLIDLLKQVPAILHEKTKFFMSL